MQLQLPEEMEDCLPMGDQVTISALVASSAFTSYLKPRSLHLENIKPVLLRV